MGRQPGQRWSRAAALVLVTAVIVAGAVRSASAEDGVQNFLSSIFGGGQPQPTYAPPAEFVAPQSGSRPLTVRPRRPKVARAAPVPTKPEKVSIFEDRTLRRGDAVMTRRGMRIFAGSNNWPYRDDDFVGIADAGRMDKSIQKTLISLDKLPRN